MNGLQLTQATLDVLQIAHKCSLTSTLSVCVISILIQWVLCSMSRRNFIGSDQNSAHPLLDDRWIARSAITRGSCIF